MKTFFKILLSLLLAVVLIGGGVLIAFFTLVPEEDRIAYYLRFKYGLPKETISYYGEVEVDGDIFHGFCVNNYAAYMLGDSVGTVLCFNPRNREVFAYDVIVNNPYFFSEEEFNEVLRQIKDGDGEGDPAAFDSLEHVDPEAWMLVNSSARGDVEDALKALEGYMNAVIVERDVEKAAKYTDSSCLDADMWKDETHDDDVREYYEDILDRFSEAFSEAFSSEGASSGVDYSIEIITCTTEENARDIILGGEGTVSTTAHPDYVGGSMVLYAVTEDEQIPMMRVGFMVAKYSKMAVFHEWKLAMILPGSFYY